MNLSALFVEATLMTLGLAMSSLALGILMAILFSLAELSHFKPLALATSTLIALLRGLPEILVVFFIYFGSTHAIFILTDEFVEISPFLAGTIALSCIYSVYASQTLRGYSLQCPKDRLKQRLHWA